MTTYERQLLTRQIPVQRRPGDKQLSNNLLNMIIVGIMASLLLLGIGSLLTAATDALGAPTHTGAAAVDISDR